MPDFTNCKQYNKTYSGANGNKICIEYNNIDRDIDEDYQNI